MQCRPCELLVHPHDCTLCAGCGRAALWRLHPARRPARSSSWEGVATACAPAAHRGARWAPALAAELEPLWSPLYVQPAHEMQAQNWPADQAAAQAAFDPLDGSSIIGTPPAAQPVWTSSPLPDSTHLDVQGPTLRWAASWASGLGARPLGSAWGPRPQQRMQCTGRRRSWSSQRRRARTRLMPLACLLSCAEERVAASRMAGQHCSTEGGMRGSVCGSVRLAGASCMKLSSSGCRVQAACKERALPPHASK